MGAYPGTYSRNELHNRLVHCGSCGANLHGDELTVHDLDPHRGGGTQRTIADFPDILEFDLNGLRCRCNSALGGGAVVG